MMMYSKVMKELLQFVVLIRTLKNLNPSPSKSSILIYINVTSLYLFTQ